MTTGERGAPTHQLLVEYSECVHVQQQPLTQQGTHSPPAEPTPVRHTQQQHQQPHKLRAVVGVRKVEAGAGQATYSTCQLEQQLTHGLRQYGSSAATVRQHRLLAM